jgi:predicted permease
LVLTTAGAVLGMVIANAGVQLLTAFAARYSPRTNDIRLDGVVFVFTSAVAIGLAVALSRFVSMPRNGSIASRVMAGGQRAGGNPRRQRVQRALVVVQVAVTIILLTGAGLLTQTIIRLTREDTGLRADPLTMRVTLLSRAEAKDTAVVTATNRRFEHIRDEIAALPGVTAVGIGGWLPLRASGVFNLVEAEGKPLAPGESPTRVEVQTANPDYFFAAGLPVLHGRAFANEDEGRGMVVVNQALTDRLFPNEDPIGKRIGWRADWRADTLQWLTIIGVVGNTHRPGIDAAPRPTMFYTMSGMPLYNPGLVIRASGPAAALAGAATRIVRRYAPSALIEQVMTIGQYRDETVAPQRLNAVLISSFSGLAVIIAAVGIAGVLAFSVSARTNEIGIRMSLGADPARVQRMILGEGAALVALGGLLGVVGAFLCAGLIRGLLFGVSARDPATFIGVAVAMAVIGMVACWIPAVRAARIDPAIAMRG